MENRLRKDIFAILATLISFMLLLAVCNLLDQGYEPRDHKIDNPKTSESKCL